MSRLTALLTLTFLLLLPFQAWGACDRVIAGSATQSLFCAMARGDFSGMAAARDKGADVNATLGGVGFGAAEVFGDAAQEFIRSNADIRRWPILTWAVALRLEEPVRILLKSGALVNATDGKGTTALHWAAWAGHYPIAKLLLENGANPHLKDASGQKPLDWAYRTGQQDVIRLLPGPTAVPDSDGDGVPDSLDKCPNTPRGASVDERGCWVAAYDSFFDTGQATIKTKFYPYIQQTAGLLKANPDVIVEVVGHTDNVGTPAYNLGLGQRRAEAVKSLLVNYGVPANRLKTTSLGLTQPVASNDTASGRAKNRRVEIRVWEPKALQ